MRNSGVSTGGNFPSSLRILTADRKRLGPPPVAFKVYDMDRDGYISNGELYLLKMMVGNNLKVPSRLVSSNFIVTGL